MVSSAVHQSSVPPSTVTGCISRTPQTCTAVVMLWSDSQTRRAAEPLCSNVTPLEYLLETGEPQPQPCQLPCPSDCTLKTHRQPHASWKSSLGKPQAGSESLSTKRCSALESLSLLHAAVPHFAKTFKHRLKNGKGAILFTTKMKCTLIRICF